MRLRKQDANGDYVAGHGNADFWHNQPEGVAQAVGTRLALFEGEWFLDTFEGTPWGGFPLNPLVVMRGQILGVHTRLTRDVALQSRALGTPGMSNIDSYNSVLEPNARQFSVQMRLTTVYGSAQLAATLQPVSPAPPAVAFSEWDAGGSIWDQGASLWDRRVT